MSEPTDDPARLTIWVTGHVQGVGFRWFVRGEARALGLAGSARNLAGGEVEIVVEGSRADCSALLERMRAPEAPGRVRSVTHRWATVQGESGFDVG